MNGLFPTLLDVSNKGQILIPSAIREGLGIKPGGKVLFYPLVQDKKAFLEPLDKNPIKAACGMLADKSGRSWSEEVLEERKKDLKREEAR